VRKTQRVGIVFAGLAVLALMIGVAPVWGQEQEQPKSPQPIQGDLVKVDTEAKTLTVKVADGAEVQFAYNDKTEISGAKGAAGLAMMKDTRVTVHFSENPQTKAKTANRIIVEPPK
jgi:hypothetical protein